MNDSTVNIPTVETPQEVKIEEIKNVDTFPSPTETAKAEDAVVVEEKTVEPKPEEVKTEEPVAEESQEDSVKIKTPAVVVDGKETYLVRTNETGDKVYAVREGKRYWVRNPESLAKMGFYLGREQGVTFAELLSYPEGEPIDMTVPDAIYPWNKPEVPKSEEPLTPYKVWQ